jgi:hypothetical protein
MTRKPTKHALTAERQRLIDVCTETSAKIVWLERQALKLRLTFPELQNKLGTVDAQLKAFK